MPTILEVSGAPYPKENRDKSIPPLDGISLTPAFDGKPFGRKSPLFMEHENNAFVIDGEWKLVGRNVSPPKGLQKKKWELYHIAEDGTELNNLAARKTEVVEDLSNQWSIWAKRVGDFPKPKGGKR